MVVVGACAAVALAAWLYLTLAHGGYWRFRETLPAGREPAEWPSVVAVVPARDEAAVLPDTLPALLAQDYPGPFGIVLVDDASTDGTAEIATTLAAARATPAPGTAETTAATSDGGALAVSAAATAIGAAAGSGTVTAYLGGGGGGDQTADDPAAGWQDRTATAFPGGGSGGDGTADDPAAGDVIAGKVTAGEVTAGDVTDWDVTAGGRGGAAADVHSGETPSGGAGRGEPVEVPGEEAGGGRAVEGSGEEAGGGRAVEVSGGGDERSGEGEEGASGEGASGEGASEEGASGSGGVTLRVVAGSGPPPGWTGKLAALAAGLAQAGEPEWVLFTDADIEHPPDSVTTLVRAAVGGRRDLVSLMARLRTDTGWERAVVPAFVYFFAQLYPFRRVARSRSRTAAAAGGCVLVRRSVLVDAGGLERIRGALIDDVALAGLVKRTGSGRIWLGLSTRVRSLRGYPRLGELWDMVARSAYTQLRYSPVLLAGTVLGLLVLYAVPPVATVVGLCGPGGGWVAATGGAGWLLLAGTYLPMLRRYRLSPGWAPLLPGVAILYAAMTVDSAWRHVRGRGGWWKGRPAPGA